MANYTLDLSGQTTGQSVTGWSERLTTDLITEVLADDGESEAGGKLLEITYPSGASNGFSLLSWDTIDADPDRDDIEILVKYKMDNVSNRSHPFLRASGTGSGDRTLYYGGVYLDGQSIRIVRQVNGTFISLASSAFTVAQDTYYWSRVRFNGSNYFVKGWADGDSEPGSWTHSGTDDNISQAGWAGMYMQKSAPGAHNTTIAGLAMATAGDTAVIDLDADLSTQPITLEGEATPRQGVAVKFTAYDNENDRTGRVELGTVLTDENGIATLPQEVPAGKKLFYRASFFHNGKWHESAGFFTNNF